MAARPEGVPIASIHGGHLLGYDSHWEWWEEAWRGKLEHLCSKSWGRVEKSEWERRDLDGVHGKSDDPGKPQGWGVSRGTAIYRGQWDLGTRIIEWKRNPKYTLVCRLPNTAQ